MKVRIKFAINKGKNNLGIENNVVSVSLRSFDVHIQKVEDNKNLDQFKDRGGADRNSRDIKKLKIVANDERGARKIFALLNLKHKIGRKGENWDFIIEKIDYDGGLDLDDATKTLTLNISEFDNSLNNIDISDYSFADGFLPSLYNPSDFRTYRTELFALEDLLSDLENNYQSPSASISNSSNELNQLLTYSSGIDTIKQHLFDLRESPGGTGNLIVNGYPHIFRPRINNFIELLREFAVWSSPEIGFTSVEQILKANANGFTIAQRGSSKVGAVTIGKPYHSGDQTPGRYESGDDHLLPGDPNVQFIKNILRGGKYKGFSIIDPAQGSPVNAKTGGLFRDSSEKVLFGQKCEQGAYQYTKTRIDRFRNFLQVNMKKDSGEATDKRKCFGFEITDISPSGHYRNFSGGEAIANKTKIVYDILMAPDLDAAIDLAFFGKPYSGMHNVDNNLLFLNEVDDKSRKEILDIYFDEGLKDPNCGRGILFPSILNSWQSKNYEINDDSKIKVNEAYLVIKKWVDILTDYEAKNHTNGVWDKDKIKQIKGSLEEWQTKAAADGTSYEWKLVDKWGSKINEVISALSAALGGNKGPGPNPPPPKPNPDTPLSNNSLPLEVLSKLAELINSETDPYAKQIYQEVKKMKASDEISLKTVEKLKELLDLVKIAQGGSTPDNTLQKLETFSLAATNSEEGKAWAIAKKAKNNKGKIWVEEALALAKVQSKLKTVIGNEEIYRKIVESIKNDILAIDQTTNIFSWAKAALAITGIDETPEVKDLKEKLETAQNYTEAWNAVNNHKENSGDKDGYATKAWKKIASFSQKRQETIEKSHLAEAQTVAELNQSYEKLKESEQFTGSLKESIEKKSYPRAQIIAAIREKQSNAKPEEQALIELIKDFVIKAEIDTDFGDNLDESVLQTLKTKKVALAKYITNNTEENKVYQNLPIEQQNTITFLVSELTEKVIKMEKAIQTKKEQDRKNNKNPNASPSTPFLKTTFGKITIVLMVVVVLGLIIWFLRSKVTKISKNN